MPWIQHLHSLGLLHAAFRPEADVCAVRSLMRHRNDLVTMASEHIQHMQKALTQMNVQFQHVISDLTGLTGLAVLDAIVAGERNPAVLAELRDPRIKASEDTIRKSLEGNWRAEHILALKQRLSLYRSHRDLIDECDQEIEKLVAAFAPRVDPDEKPMPDDRKQKQRKRKKKSGSPDFNMRAEAYKLFGVDLTQIPGLMTLVFMLFSEVGRDMSRWPTAGHFVSWLGLCPDNDISGGKVLWRGARQTKNRAGTLFRLAAHGLHRDQTPMGDYLRRMKAKLGPAAATTATAHKIAIIFYTMVSKRSRSTEPAARRATSRWDTACWPTRSPAARFPLRSPPCGTVPRGTRAKHHLPAVRRPDRERRQSRQEREPAPGIPLHLHHPQAVSTAGPSANRNPPSIGRHPEGD